MGKNVDGVRPVLRLWRSRSCNLHNQNPSCEKRENFLHNPKIPKTLEIRSVMENLTSSSKVSRTSASWEKSRARMASSRAVRLEEEGPEPDPSTGMAILDPSSSPRRLPRSRFPISVPRLTVASSSRLHATRSELGVSTLCHIWGRSIYTG